MPDIRDLHERLMRAPHPTVGRDVGDFEFHDGLLLGYAEQAARGMPVDPYRIPKPDMETTRFAAELRAKDAPTEEEREFLTYHDLLEEVREELRQQES